MSFTSDCNLRDVFSNWGHGPLCTCRHMHKSIQTHAWLHYKGNSLKSLSREVVTSAALFTRLMPRCTQERVNQARGYTDVEPPVDHSQSPSEPERGYAMHWRPHRDELERLLFGTLTIHNSSTDDRGLGRAKTFRASMRSALLYVASYAWLNDEQYHD